MDIQLRLQDYWKSLSDCSRDDNAKAALIESPLLQAYKLDTIAKYVCKRLRGGMTLAGCDAYLEKNGKYYFIEFKNQDSAEVSAEDIRKKAYDSISTLRMAIDQKIQLDDLCENALFFVVFRDEQPPALLAAQKKTGELAEEEPILFGLRKIKGKLYKEIHTIPKADFCRDWIPKIWPELSPAELDSP